MASDTIAVRYSNRRMLLVLTQNGHSGAILFVPCADPVPVGRHVRLKVTFGDCGDKSFYLDGVIQSARDRSVQPVGFNLLIQGDTEERALSHLLAFCSSRREPAKRFPAAIACGIRLGSEMAQGKIRDLSTTGAFVATSSNTARPGTKLVLSIRGGFLKLSTYNLEARVAWAGVKNGLHGFGAEFLPNTPHVVELVRRHAAAGS